ncbi:MAG: hypothetical protein WDM70_03840 [Nitrosomonadales bacterium]
MSAPQMPVCVRYVAANHDIFQCAHVGEQANVLERARNAASASTCGLAVNIGYAIECELSLIQLVIAR